MRLNPSARCMRSENSPSIPTTDITPPLQFTCLEQPLAKIILHTGTPLTDDEDGKSEARFFNDFDFFDDDILVISEPSVRFDDRYFELGMLEHRARGRVLVYNERTRDLREYVGKLYTPNGVQAIGRGCVLIAEMGLHRILK
ncbi:hypothetical protein L596_005591 [Steinernema carpocapsae]|uniref:Strictosidine synthase conserved region domain-containing protein n=1 Tax=Steinernema carpocapsae TaxID=34508 RepID=A0A4V6I8Q8_STECR|nr:hypothetical protein L596_005591 [Steinernema carpocapsae]